MNNKTWYEADKSHMGDGDLCGHHHKTYTAALKCLPRLPKQSRGSLTRYFSMAYVHHFAVEGEIANVRIRLENHGINQSPF